MRKCKYCNQLKSYDSDARPNSKASGFFGARCWDCRNRQRSLSSNVNAEPYMRLCKTCSSESLCVPTAKPSSKENGFHGNTCWACHVRASRLKQQELVTCEITGETIRYSTARSRKLVTYELTGETIKYGAARTRKYYADPDNYAKVRVSQGIRRGKKKADEDKLKTLQTRKEIRAAGLTLDHIVPMDKGGKSHWRNYNGLSGSTNQSKGTKELKGTYTCWLHDREAGRPLDYYEQRVIQELSQPENLPAMP